MGADVKTGATGCGLARPLAGHSSGNAIWCISASDKGMQPSVKSTAGNLSGSTCFAFGTGRGAGVGALEVDASASKEAVMETLPIVTLEAASEASSSLSVSVRSRGHLIAGAPSRNSKGSNPVPFLKKWTSKVHSSLQSEPARAIKRCCNASPFKAAALDSSLAASQNNRRA